MRHRFVVVLAILVLAACSEPGVGPNEPLVTAPTVQLSHLGADPALEDLCGGLSPCDAYDYRGDGSTGAPGMCFLPPTVDNHLSDPACSAPNTPGLDGIFQLAWCQVEYSDPTGATAPTIVPGTCQDPSQWVPLEEEDGQYAASVRWTRGQADDGDVFRVYVVRGDRMFAHRDLVIDPRLTRPADDFLHSIGYGTEPIKLVITDDFSCVRYDTQGGTEENAATCVIDGATSFTFVTEEMTTTFNFPFGNPTFVADFEVSECLPLGFDYDEESEVTSGNALVDTPLADCKISLSSEELDMLTVPGQIQITLTDPRWGGTGPFDLARLNVLQYDEYGTGALPPSADPGWFGLATSSSAALRWLGWGLDKLADLLLPEPAYAAFSGGWDFTRMSDFQVAVMPVMDAASVSDACPSGVPSCFDLGTFDGDDPVSVSVQVSAPTSSGPATYPDDHIDVPDARLHFFPESGTLACPIGSGQNMSDPHPRGCVAPGQPDYSTTPSSTWDHFVVVTGTDGLGTIDWTLAEGSNTLHVSACGIARPGANEPNPPGEPGSDHVWGDLGDCSDRSVAMSASGAYDNGAADGFTPFEPVDILNEAAIYGLPLTFTAATCPQITVNGLKGDATGTAEWETCAEKTVFTAPLKGPKVENNAALYTYSDGEALYIGLEVQTNELGNKIFINLPETVVGNDGVEAAGDDLLQIDFGNPSASFDWHFTQACVGNNAASLCGDPDGAGDGAFAVAAAATLDGAGSGKVFYEFVRPLGSPNAAAGPGKQDLGGSSGQQVGLRVRVSQGQGGGKGGFVYPDPQTSPVKFHVFTLD